MLERVMLRRCDGFEKCVVLRVEVLSGVICFVPAFLPSRAKVCKRNVPDVFVLGGTRTHVTRRCVSPLLLR